MDPLRKKNAQVRKILKEMQATISRLADEITQLRNEPEQEKTTAPQWESPLSPPAEPECPESLYIVRYEV